MFNNNGNSAYTFKAQYTNSFTLDKFQLHEVLGDSGVDFSVDYNGYYVRINHYGGGAIFIDLCVSRTLGLIQSSPLTNGGTLVSTRKFTEKDGAIGLFEWAYLSTSYLIN